MKMSETAMAANEAPVTPVDTVSVAKESVETTVANAANTNCGVSNVTGVEDFRSAATKDGGKNTISAEAAAVDANSIDVPLASTDVAVSASANLQPANVDGVEVISAQVKVNVSVSAQATLNDSENTREIEKNSKAERVERNKGEVSQDANTKESSASEMKEGTAEEAKVEPTSPNSLPKQKASFNVDAKPFSPGSLADPAMQGTLVGESNGVSIKVGQWGSQPFSTLPHIPPGAPASIGQVPYVVPVTTQQPPVRKEGSGAKESLSAFAKPWSPHPEVTIATIPPPENEVAIHPGSWITVNVDGNDIQTPSPMVPKEMSNNSYTHSYSIHPKGLKSVELELFNYVCGRCPLKTLYGRLSSRQPDVTMRNVAMDVPPLCIAHLIEQITKAKVTALCVNEMEGTHYDIWLDKPNMAPVLTEVMSGSVWTCPMHHGFAVLGKGEEGKKYLRNYVERLNDSRPDDSSVHEVLLVEVEH